MADTILERDDDAQSDRPDRPMQATVSVQAMEWVLDHSPATGTDRLVLLAIARHADRHGEGAFPSAATLAAEAKVDRRNAFRSLQKLETAGAIRVEHGGGRHKPNTYSVVMERCQDDTVVAPETVSTTVSQRHPSEPETVSNLPETVSNRARNGVTAPPEPTTNQLQPTTKPTPPTPPAAVSQIFAAWQESTGKSRARLDPKRRSIIDRALKAYPLDDLLAAVTGWKHSPHHRGENRTRTVYNDLELLLRDAKHIEMFRDLAIDGPPVVSRVSAGQDAITRVFGPEGGHDGFGSVPQLPPGNAGQLAAGIDR